VLRRDPADLIVLFALGFHFDVEEHLFGTDFGWLATARYHRVPA